MTPCRSLRPWRWTLAFCVAQALWLPLLRPAAMAQDARPEQKSNQADRAKEPKLQEPVQKDRPEFDRVLFVQNPGLFLKEPTSWRVYQRDANNRADVPIEIDPRYEKMKVLNVTLSTSSGGFGLGAVPYRDGKLVGVPAGGPYQAIINVAYPTGEDRELQITATIGSFFVGDLWVLAGQSNMQGLGILDNVTPPTDRVALLGMDGKWSRAEEPLHWLVDSPDPVHSGDPATREERSRKEHATRKKGAGLGLPFAATLTAATGVPIGLIATAHGGTSMAQWDPSKKDRGGRSLYGSMLGQVSRAGGKVRGVLWYQGEAEANPEASKAYPRTMVKFIASIREDQHDPDLPFYLVQLGRFVHEGPSDPWNAVQDAQRRIPDRVPSTAVVAAVDLELDDGIHIGTHGLKRLGGRLARIAERELFGMAGATNPTFERVNQRGDATLVVKFKGVNRVPTSNGTPAGIANPAGSLGQTLAGLQPARHIAGFSIRKADGTEIPMIYDAAVGPSKDTVILRLTGKVPEGAMLWYGHGLDPFCNLTDQLDMAVPVFGPVPLDEVE
jgi:sialate O-acetylesterase